MVGRFNREDSGFTLTELIVVLTLLGVVLSISYGALIAVFSANDVALRHATFANEVGAPMHVVEKILTQTITLEEAEQYRITVITDRDRDNSVERHTIEALADGTLRHRTWLTDSLRQNTELTFDATWSTNNANQAELLPLVYYYGDVDDDGVDERLTGAFDEADVRTVDINILVDVDGNQYQDTRKAHMRNRGAS